MKRTEMLITAVGVLSMILFPVIGHQLSYLTLKESLLLAVLILYAVLLALLYAVLSDTREIINKMEKDLKVQKKFSKIGTDLISDSMKEYLSYKEHRNPLQLMESIMDSIQKSDQKIRQVLFEDSGLFELSPDRLHKLLEKYKNGTITEAEAKELQELLEAEKAKKEKEGNDADAMFIALLILGLLLWLASRKD